MKEESLDAVISDSQGSALGADASKMSSTDRSELIQALGGRKEAGDYLKLLGDEIKRLEVSRTRHAYLVWLLVATFFVIYENLGQLPLFSYEKIDKDLLLKAIPAAIAFFYYVSVSRNFLIRELGSMFIAVAEGLYPSDAYPFAEYISPGSFMRTEKFLHLTRPQHEMLGYIFMLGLVVTATVWVPIVACFYDYYLLLTMYPFDDWPLRISLIVGIVFMTQALVITEGNRRMVKQGLGGNVRLNMQPMFVVKK